MSQTESVKKPSSTTLESDGASGQSFVLKFSNIDLATRGALRFTVAGDTVAYVKWDADLLDLPGLMHKFQASVPGAGSSIHSLGCTETDQAHELVLIVYIRADQDLSVELVGSGQSLVIVPGGGRSLEGAHVVITSLEYSSKPKSTAKAVTVGLVSGILLTKVAELAVDKFTDRGDNDV